MNATTRRHPRTTEEAFGPYARGPITEQPAPMHPADRIVLWSCGLAAASLALAMLVWG